MIAFDQIRRLSSNSSMMFGHCITNANSCDIFITIGERECLEWSSTQAPLPEFLLTL